MDHHPHHLVIKYRPLAELIPYARNAKTHSAEQVANIAKSIQEFGFVNPVLIGKDGGLIAGHGRCLAGHLLKLETVPTIELGHLSERQRRALVLADNKIAEGSGWNFEILASELSDLVDLGVDLEGLGFNEQELDALLREDLDLLPGIIAPPKPALEYPSAERERIEAREGLTQDDQAGEAIEDLGPSVSVLGDIWNLGDHRVMCGDSTDPEHVAALMNGKVAKLIHADPPYGMGKEADGVAGDNVYREHLDAFQMKWWQAFRAHATENVSAYIWGNSPDLWRLWYRGGLEVSEYMECRNEIVWDKKAIPGMASPGLTQYPEASERCLFIQVGNQWSGNINTADFFDGWEPVRAYLEAEAKSAEITPAKIVKLLKVQMYSHWFTKSQWAMIPQKHYETLAATYAGRFLRPWPELKAIHDKGQAEFRKMVTSRRSYFDNAHDIMRDVWEFPCVVGDERHGHATPKPVAMMERVIKSSSAPDDVIVEPFGGSGSTLIAAEKLRRQAHVMELVPGWVDTIVRRWEKFTGQTARHVSGLTFAELKKQRGI